MYAQGDEPVCPGGGPRRTVEGVSAQSPRSSGRKKQSNKPITDATGTIPTLGVNADTTSLAVANTSKLTWRDRAHRVVAADSAPTWSLDLRAIQDGVEEQRARVVLDLSMRIAEALLSTGASAAEVTATVLRLTSVYGLRSVHVDVTFTSISLCHYRGSEAPVTMMRTVRVRTQDYERLGKLQRLVDDLEEDRVGLDEARRRFDRLAASPHPYRRSVVTLATALLGMSVCILLDGSPVEVALSLLNALIVDRAQLWLARRKLPAFFSQMVGGAIPTLVAVALIYARTAQVPGLETVSASTVVATGIVVLLAGLSVVGAAQDAIDGYYITASARAFEVVALTLGVIVGVLIVLTVSTLLGAPTYLSPYSQLSGDFVVQVASSALIAGTFAISSYAGPRTALVCVATGSLGWIAYAFMSMAGFGAASASGIAALAVGVVSSVLARVWSVPSLALSTAGIVALLPGLAVYRGLYHLATYGGAQGYGPAFDALGGAMAVGLALAAGVSLGRYLGRAAQRDAGRIADKARERALRRSHADAKE